MGLIVFRVCFKRPFFNASWIMDLGMPTLEAKVPTFLQKIEWYSFHFCIKFNNRNLTATATAR